MDILDLQNKMVAVLGFGLKEGAATAEFLIKHGIKPVLFDRKPWEEWEKPQQDYIKSLGLNIIFGPDYLEELKGFDAVFRSPAMPVLNAQLVELQERGLKVTSQTKWFFEHYPCKIIGVTGTKGKGTTSTLISEILKLHIQKSKSKARVYLTGNIGEIQPFEFLENLSPDDWVVYELSSFQLQDLEQSPHIGVVLMVTQEHLDHHKSVEEYRLAKSSIVKFQGAGDFAVINADFGPSMEIGKLGNGQKIYFSRKQELESGCFIEKGGMAVKDVCGLSFEFPVSQLQLRGEHNFENVCAASAAAAAAGAGAEAIAETLKNFRGLKHRLQLVGVKDGISFYNDSFSTVPETAMAAIEAFHEPEVVILGGSSKHSDFTDLGKTICQKPNVKAVILIGEEAGRIRKAIEDAGTFSGVIDEGVGSMAEIFAHIRRLASSGDVVLLSPACASFGMFKNYKDRGDQFIASVNDW